MGGVLSPRRGRVTIPESFPGQFFVLEFDRVGRTFTMHLDDEDRSTFDLDDDIEPIRTMFRIRGFPVRQTDELIDLAMEFGLAQYIPTAGSLVPDRVLPILPREARQPKGLSFKDIEEPRDGNWIHSLRR